MHYPILSAAALRLALLLAAALLLLTAAAWLALRLGRQAWPGLLGVRDRLVRWARPRAPNPLARLVVSLLDPAQPESGGLLVAALLLLGGGWAFFGLLEDVLDNDPMVLVDRAVFAALQQFRAGWLDQLMVGVTELGSAPVIVPVVLAVGAVLAFHRRWRPLGYWVATILFGRVLVWVLKSSVARPRPNQSLYHGLEQFSFPSGHAASSVVLFGFLAFLLARGRPRAQRAWITAAAVTLIALISFSRLYLGAHWMSDVLGSFALGTAWVALASIAYTFHAKAADLPRRALLLAALGTLLIAGVLYIGLRHGANMQRYAVQARAPLVELQDWRGSGWRTLPGYRIDLERKPREPLSLQWAAPADAVASALRAAGWQPAPPLLDPAALLASFTARPEIAALPLRPEFHEAALPVLSFVHAAQPGRRLVLRLWPSGRSVPAAAGAERAMPLPLWVGSVREQSLQHWLGLLSWAEPQPDGAAPPPLHALQQTFSPLPPATAPRIEPVVARPLLLLH